MLKRVLLALATTTAACYAPQDPEPSLGEYQGDVICEPFCDPYNYQVDDTLRAAESFARQVFGDTLKRSEDCVDLAPVIECFMVIATSASPCGPVTIDCVNSGSRVRCGWFNVAGCD